MAQDPIISFIPENDEAFRRGIERLARATDDFRIPFGLIGKDFYRSNKIIFGLKSAGLYPPLGGFNYRDKVGNKTKRELAEERKKKRVGFAYPLLVGETSTLQKSLSSPSGQGAEFFIGRKTLIMGTSVSYAKFHQSDRTPRTKLPQRKMIFISGGPGEKSKDSRIAGRRERWLNIINDYAFQLTKGYNRGTL